MYACIKEENQRRVVPVIIQIQREKGTWHLLLITANMNPESLGSHSRQMMPSHFTPSYS